MQKHLFHNITLLSLMFFQFPLSLVRYRAFLDIVMLTFCWNIRKVITICLFNIRNIVIWCVRFFLSGKTLKGTHPQQLKHALICNLDVSLECTNFEQGAPGYFVTNLSPNLSPNLVMNLVNHQIR